GRGFLAGVVAEDYRAVLSADVRTLAVERSGVVDVPEHFQQLLVRNNRRIVFQMHNLGVTGAVRAYHRVRGVTDGPAHVANCRGNNSVQRCEGGLDVPEASGSKGSNSGLVVHLAFSQE